MGKRKAEVVDEKDFKRPSTDRTSHYNNNSYSTNTMWGSSSSGSSSRRSKGSSSRMNTSSGGYSSRSSVNEKEIIKMFTIISDEDDPTVASMEGICKLCEELEIDAMEDVRVLVLLWQLGANDKPAQINKDEWCKGCTSLQVDSIPKIKALLPSLDPGFLLDHEFKEFYKFTFQFNREGTHRTLDKDLVIAMLKMVLNDRVDEQRIASFIDFLENGASDSAYSRITLDQWMSIFDFCKECRDLNDYDEETSAWPVLDEYVDFMKKK